MRDLSRLIAVCAGHGANIGHLRRAAARRPAALDPDAQRLPAARAGPPLRPRPGRGRLRPVAGPRRGRVSKIAAMLAKATEQQQPALPAAAGAAHNTQGGRFARDPGEYASTAVPSSVQLTLIPGGTRTDCEGGTPMTTTTPAGSGRSTRSEPTWSAP